MGDADSDRADGRETGHADSRTIDNRRHTRVRLEARADLELPGAAISGRVVDLSFGGAFLEAPGTAAQVGDEGRLSVLAEGCDGPMRFTCRVVRVVPAGLGLRLLQTDPAGHECFAEMVRRAGGTGRLLDEWRVSPGFSISTSEGQKRALD
ncbi:MAG: PilZ domain-containing protein [Nitrospirota bacterium]|nr:PilZ domain-containing protein [Nitrospirota bacterium]